MARRSRAAERLTLGQVIDLIDGTPHGPDHGDAEVAGVAEFAHATAHHIIFVADQRRLPSLGDSEALAAIVPEGLANDAQELFDGPIVEVADPHSAVAAILERLFPTVAGWSGVHPDALVDPTARLGNGVVVGPGAVIDASAQVGDDSEVGPGCYVGHGVTLGEACVLHANTSLYEGTRLGDRVLLHSGVVVGADGFGFARDAGTQLKIPQVGGVVIGDDVEIGANSCVDRGTLRETSIGAGTKIDNLVQIGHNCQIGQGCAISALSGLAGSTVLEDGVIMGGNVGTAGHQVIGANTLVAAKSGVHGDIAPGSMIAGSPHLDIRKWRRSIGAFAKLPELIRRVRRLERTAERSDEE